MLLQAMMKLDATGFTNPLNGVRSSVSGAIKSLAALAGVTVSVVGTIAGLKNSLQLGGSLSELSQRIGTPVKDLVILRQAFEDTGVGADAGVLAITQMQKSLSGMNDEGQPTNKMFKQLGLNLEDLKGMGAADQIQAIGRAVMNLQNPAEQTAASMAIFGRSGASMKQFFADPAAIETAAKSLGSMPAVLERNAALFDSIGDAMGRIKAKATGFFAGIMEGIAPALKSITDSLETIDFTKWGVEIGKVIGILIEAFKEGKLGRMVGLSLMIGFGDAVNFLVGTIGSAQFWKGVGQLVLGAFLGIGGALLKIFMTPITYLQAGMDKVVDELFAALAKVPGIGKAMGLENYGEAKSFKEHLTDREQNGFFLKDAANESSKMASDMMASGMANLREGMKPKNVIDTSEWKSTLSDLWGGLSLTFEAKQKDLQEAANTLVPVGTNSLQAIGDDKAKVEQQRTNLDILSDRFSKIGLFVGGGATDIARKTANATERMAKTLDKYLPKLVNQGNPVAAWGA